MFKRIRFAIPIHHILKDNNLVFYIDYDFYSISLSFRLFFVRLYLI